MRRIVPPSKFATMNVQMKRKFLKIRLRTWAILLVVIFFVVLIATRFGGADDEKKEQIEVRRGSIMQNVIVTGKTEPKQDVELAFERGGKVAHVFVKIGDQVSPGKVLAELDRAELYAQFLDAKANLDSQIAKLDELKKGTRIEDIKIKQTELEKAEQDLANYYRDVPDVANDSYVNANDAVRKQADEIFSDDESQSPQLSFSISNSQLETNLEASRSALTEALGQWKSEIGALAQSSPATALDTALTITTTRLLHVRDLLNLIMSAIIANTGLSQTTITSYKANITTALTNVNTSIARVNSKTQSILSQKLAVRKIQDELSLKLAGSTPEAIRAQEASARQAEAKVKVAEAQLAHTVLRAPIAGIVTQQDAKVGEIVGTNVKLVTLISQGELKIEANVPEADIAKITIGNRAEVTLDAYGNHVVFGAHVVAIDPGETVIDGVPTYKTTILFDTYDARARTGMTANVTIETAKKEDALILPQRVIVNKDRDSFVSLVEGETTRQVKVTTGIRGSDGNIEIVDGVREGDQIIIPE